MSKAKTKPRRDSERSVHAGSGNVFVDMGVPDADERLAKVELAQLIRQLIHAAGLSQAAAGQTLGIDKPTISALLRGRLKDFSTERLMRFITALNRDVVITVRDPQDEKRPSVRVLLQA